MEGTVTISVEEYNKLYEHSKAFQFEDGIFRVSVFVKSGEYKQWIFRGELPEVVKDLKESLSIQEQENYKLRKEIIELKAVKPTFWQKLFS